MVAAMKTFFDAALDNIAQFGDTDIFPYPIENHIIFDEKEEICKLLRKSYSHFPDCFVQHPPSHIGTLCPLGPSGFRWATQLDPYWNAFLLGLTLSVADAIEAARISTDKETVFSYRVDAQYLSGKIYRDDVSWKDFISCSLKRASTSKYVVLVDIADCYHRIPHHRLENALQQLGLKSAATKQIMSFLENFSNTKSYSVPVGGPAARLLVELVLNLTDQLLKSHRVKYCRYADDYHIFVDSIDEAYEKLYFISEKLLRNDGLALQKSKTRIMTAAEFVSSHSIFSDGAADNGMGANKLFSLKLRFDPYSSRSEEDYADLKTELGKIDILGLLNLELAKTRVHGALTKRIISAIRHLDGTVRDSAILTLLQNLDVLYSLFPVVAVTIKSCFDDLSSSTRSRVCEILREKIIDENYLISSELHAAYTIRILGSVKNSENEDALVTLYNRFRSPLVRRDVILVMAKWKEYPWLSDQINEYPNVSPWEKRAFLIASYVMGDAGKHWREHMKKKFDPFEIIVRNWMTKKSETFIGRYLYDLRDKIFVWILVVLDSSNTKFRAFY